MADANRQPPIASGSRLLVVLGMHRSGTSALTGVLHALGFQAGKTLLPATEFNERGYFEDAFLTQQHDALLHALERSWDDERALPHDWLERAVTDEAQQSLATRLRAEFDLERPCVIKDPRLCRLLPVWQRIFSELDLVPGYLLSVRHPLEVAESLMKRDRLPAQRALLLYAVYLLEAERATRGRCRAVVDYAALLQDWRGAVQQSESALGIALLPSNEADARRVDDFLAPDLRHCRVADPESVVPESFDWDAHRATPMRLALAVYRLLTGVLDASALRALDVLQEALERYLSSLEPWLISWQTERSEFARFRREFFENSDFVERLVEKDARSVLYWSDSAASPVYSEMQTVRQPWHFGSVQKTLRFVLPPQVTQIGALRWDIADRPAFCELFAAWLENAQGARVWQWSPGTPLFVAPSAGMILLQPVEVPLRLWIGCTDFDPYAELSLPPELLTQITAGWTFAATFSSALPAAAMPRLAAELARYAPSGERQQPLVTPPLASDLADLVALLRQHLDANEQTIAQQSLRLQRQQESQKRLQEELLRAEAQLELLKDLFLHDAAY